MRDEPTHSHDEATHPYAALTPDCILDAVESFGLRCDGRLLALNSYENRVYLVGVEEGPSVVAKFYRPGRWRDAAILEEHAFSAELAAHEIPAVPPLADASGHTLISHNGFRMSLYPRAPGREPPLDDASALEQIGRLLGRLHAVGAARPFLHRPVLGIERFGREPAMFLLENDFIPADLRVAWTTLIEDLLARITVCFDRAGATAAIRLHGDCHPGNILWTPEGAHFVDLDDSMTGPAVQDLWMLLSGPRAEQTAQLCALMDGYTTFHDFDPRELHLIEALRGVRMLHYAGWLARRWDDPAFPRHFPWFNTVKYWQDLILSLREQAAAMDEPPLSI